MITYEIKVQGAVHTAGLTLDAAVRFATEMGYDGPKIRAKLLNKGKAIVADDVGRSTIQAEQAYARQ